MHTPFLEEGSMKKIITLTTITHSLLDIGFFKCGLGMITH